MEFRTKVNTPKSSIQLQHSDSLFLLGSCFSSNIAERLHHYKFRSLANPLGISYNPISLHNSLFKIENLVWERSIQDTYYNYNFHSDLNGLSVEACQKKYKELYDIQSSFIQTSNTIFITYGTAWVYELKSNNRVVNNCHKQKSTAFRKRMLSIDEITQSWEGTIKKLSNNYQKEFNFIFTVSPIRHLKNGFHENQLSKSVLLLAVDAICKKFANCSYFPSYELLLDDLRDYRFYEPNLTHPSSTAIDYIWQKIDEMYFNEETKRINQQVLKLQQALNHKPFHEGSTNYKDFTNNLKQKLIAFQEQTQIDFSKEIRSIE